MPVSWFDSKTSLVGPFDQSFLLSIEDMQDFVVDVIEMGPKRDFGLLFEM